MQIRTGTSSYAEHFSFIKLSDGSYKILTRMTGGERVVIVKSGLKDDGTKVTQNNYNATANEQWELIPTTVPANDYCFEMGIYASNEKAVSGIAGGHAFLSFRNLTGRNVQFGPIFLKPNETMTLTKWLEDGIHAGVWYNRDTAIDDMELKNYVYMTDKIKGSALTTILNYCKNNDSYWVADNNCTTLSGELWNQLSSKKLTYKELNAGLGFDIPAILKHSIMQYPEYCVGKTFPLASDIGYLDEYRQFEKCTFAKGNQPKGS